MKVLIDSEIFTRQRFGGVSRQFVEIARNLPLLNFTDTEIVSRWHFNQHLREFKTEVPGKSKSTYLPKFPNSLRKYLENQIGRAHV